MKMIQQGLLFFAHEKGKNDSSIHWRLTPNRQYKIPFSELFYMVLTGALIQEGLTLFS